MLKFHRLAMLCTLLSAAFMLTGAELLKVNFHPGDPALAGGVDGSNFTLIEKDGRNTLKITRVSPAVLSIAAPADAPENRRQTISFSALPGPTDQCCALIRFRNRKSGKTVATMRFNEDNLVDAIINGHGHFGTRSEPLSWQEYRVVFSPGSEQWLISRRLPGGEWRDGNPIPYENHLPIDEIDFITSPAKSGNDNTIYLSDLRIDCEDHSSLDGRENVLLSACDTEAAIIDGSGTARPAPRLNDGETADESAEIIAGLPAVLEFTMAEPVMVSTFRISSGNFAYLNNPSGELAVTDYKVEGKSAASGQWRELFTRNALPGAKAAGAAGPEQFFDIVDFDPLELSALRVTLLGSNDTGRRADPGAKPPPTAVVREVALFTHEAVANARRQLGSVLQAEFRLPVYRDQREAQLYAILDETVPALEIELAFKERHQSAVPVPPRRITLRSGQNIIPVEIADWPDGEYRASIRAAGRESGFGGEFGRLLRINRVPAAAIPAGPENVAGKKLFFPDFHYLADAENLKIEVTRPEVHRVGHTFLAENELVQLGSGIGFNRDGKLVVRYNCFDREWKPESIKKRYAVADPADLSQWELFEGEPADVEFTTTPLMQAGKSSGGSDFIGYSWGADRKFRFYDPEQDGPIPLDQLKIQYSGYKPVDWGVIKAPPQSTWVMWPKGEEILLVGNKPLLQDNISGGEFEDPTNSNDNFAGQWLAPDGKTFYYVRGRLLKRYPPFVARYDNLWQIVRILTVFTTTDGINWKQNYFALPDENDPETAQHYGAAIFDVPDGNGLMFAYLDPYSALHQQYHVELVYSWDGRNWQRFPGHPAWIPPGKPGEWNFGHSTLHNNTVDHDGYTYHLIGWGAELPHFGGDVAYSNAEMAKLDGEALKRRFGKRDLEKWPYFRHYGSYERLADAIKTMGITPGVFRYRRDGWVALTAGDTPGSFETREFTATGNRVVANAAIAPDGYIELELVDADGRIVAETRLAGDDLRLPVFDQLPAGTFKLRGKMRNARLYTLDFTGR